MTAPLWLAALSTLLCQNSAPPHDAPRTLRVEPGPQGSAEALESALKAARPGDTILLSPGVYVLKSALELDQKNPSTKPITLASRKSRGVVLDGSRLPFDGTPATNGDIFTVTGSGYVLRNLTLKGARRIAVNLWGGKDVTIEGCTIRDSWRGAVYMGAGASSLRINKCEVFLNCRINENRDIPGSAGWPSAVNLGDHSSITRSSVYENWGEGIGFYGIKPYVGLNTVRDNYSVGIYACNVEGGVIERNFVTTTRDRRFFRKLYGVEGPAFGIAIANESKQPPFTKDFRIQNNVVVGGIFTLFYWRFLGIGGLNRVTITHNTFVGGEAAALRIEEGSHEGSLIVNNIFTNPGGELVSKDGLPNSLAPLGFRNNICWGAGVPSEALREGSIIKDPLVSGSHLSAISWRPGPKSPARSAAIRLGQVADDFLGRRRPADRASEIGALQAEPDRPRTSGSP